MISFPQQQSLSRRAFLTSSAATLALSGCSQSMLGSSSLAENGFDAERLVAAIKSNQIVFEPVRDRLVPVVKCPHRVPLHRIAKTARQAVVAIEDRRFYSHRGFDPLAMPAVIAGGFARGGSTITMQLIKNTILSPVRDPARKVEELRLASHIEKHLSKDQILVYYLNFVNFGHLHGGVPINGIETASRYYFGRTAADIDLYQSAVLAGMLRAPNRLKPTDHPEASHDRAIEVLRQMVEQNMISSTQMEEALRSRRPRGTAEALFAETRDFAQWVLSEVRREHPGFTPRPYTRVLITLQGETQFRAREALDRQMKKSVAPSAQAAFVTLSPSGRIACMIGQRDYAAANLNYATQTRRQPASTFKAIVYLAALEEGAVTHSRKLTADFATSENHPARQLYAKVGAERVVAYARQLGVESLLRADPSLALGASETTLLEMTSAFTAFASRGFPGRPFGYFGIIENGSVWWWTRGPNRRRVFGETRARQMHEMLRAVVTDGTGKLAASLGECAGKTGTTSGPRDAWFIGYTPKHVSGLWIGMPNNAVMDRRMTGSTAAGIWAQIEKALPAE